jgi:hypothetical protein
MIKLKNPQAFSLIRENKIEDRNQTLMRNHQIRSEGFSAFPYILRCYRGEMMENEQDNIVEWIEDIKIFLPQIILASEAVGELMYEPINDAFWKMFGEVVEGIDDLYKTLSVITKEMSRANCFSVQQSYLTLIKTDLSSRFQVLNYCMDEEDWIGASDCIKYELVPLFKKLVVSFGCPKREKELCFTKNMSYFQKSFPEVYLQINSLDLNINDYQVGFALNNIPNLTIMTSENIPVSIYSQYNSVYITNLWADSLFEIVKNKSDIIMYGLGFGYHAQSYSELYPEHKLFIYEPDEQVLLAAMTVIDFETLFSKLNLSDFVVGTKKDQKHKFLYNFIKYMGDTPEIVRLPIYDRIKNDNHNKFYEDAKSAIINYFSTNVNYEKYALQWTKNTMYNLVKTMTSPSIKHLKDRFLGLTAVIVGAGPSLKADIESLRELKNHAFIIAAGSTIQALEYFEIKPHLVISMDGTEANYQAFKDMNLKKIPLLFTPMIENRILNKEVDTLIHVNLGSDWTAKYFMDLTEQDPIFRSNHSVSGTAIQAAIYMGFKEIIFTGQDFSYPENHIYTTGANHITKEVEEIVIKNSVLTVANVSGDFNRTNEGMLIMLEDIENLIEQHSEIQFINTSKFGARIKHTLSQSMEDILYRLKKDCIQDDLLIKTVEQNYIFDEMQFKKTKGKIEKLPSEMVILGNKFNRINQMINKLPELSITNPNKCFKLIKSIDSDWEFFVNSSSYKGLFMRICRNEFNDFERDLIQLTSEMNLLGQARFYQNSMQPLISIFIRLLPQVLEIVHETNQRFGTYMESKNLLG